MAKFETLKALPPAVREAVINLLYRLADDELITGHRSLEGAGGAPIPEADVALSSAAREEIGHARAFYEVLQELGEPGPDVLVFGRRPREFRCASLVCLPGGDWAFSVMRRFLFDSAEAVRLAALAACSLVPLAQLVARMRGEEKFHLMNSRGWVLRLGKAAPESRQRMQAALDFAYPHALALFEPTEYDETLAQAGICPREDELRRQWESAAAPVLADAGLVVPDAAQPLHGGRVGRHPTALKELLDSMIQARNADPTGASKSR